MGAHKPLLPFRGARLIDAVIARARPQVEALAIDVPPASVDAYAYENVLPDAFAEKLGPLCGVVTGLQWCEADWLATFPCDTPFLPQDLVAQLGRIAQARPVVAAHGGRVQGVCALWPRSVLASLRRGIEAGALRSMRGALEIFDAVECPITAPDHAFFNVNTPQDLAEAEKLSLLPFP